MVKRAELQGTGGSLERSRGQPGAKKPGPTSGQKPKWKRCPEERLKELLLTKSRDGKDAMPADLSINLFGHVIAYPSCEHPSTNLPTNLCMYLFFSSVCPFIRQIQLPICLSICLCRS